MIDRQKVLKLFGNFGGIRIGRSIEIKPREDGGIGLELEESIGVTWEDRREILRKVVVVWGNCMKIKFCIQDNNWRVWRHCMD